MIKLKFKEEVFCNTHNVRNFVTLVNMNNNREISNKDQVIQTLQDEIQNYKVVVHDIKTMAISEMNLENKTLKSTVRKEIKTTTVVGAHLKVAGFIRKKFLFEKKLPSK